LDDLTKSNEVIYISQNQIKNKKLIKKQEFNLEEDKKKKRKKEKKRDNLTLIIRIESIKPRLRKRERKTIAADRDAVGWIRERER